MSDSTLLPPAVLELHQEDDDAWGAPPGPLCSVCEHPVCPMCPEPWCDRFVEGGRALADACCDTACTVDPIEFADWKDRALDVLMGRDHRCSTPIEEHTCWTDQLGPYCPTWRRQARRCTMCASLFGEDAPGASYVASDEIGLQWFECPEHDELDNLAETRRVRRELLSTWFERLRAYMAKANALEASFAAPPPALDDLQLWGIPPKGEQ